MSISSRTRSKLKLRQREEEGVPVGVKRSKLKLKQREEEEVSLEVKLPEDIHVKIFLKLPGKSILSCRCVCKSFYNLLCCPIFIKNHLNIHSKSNPKLLCFHRTWKNYSPPRIYSIPIDYTSISSLSCDGAILINYPFESNKTYHYNNILGSCNGLVCLKIVCSDTAENVHNCYYSILNPLTGEYKDFLGPPNHVLKTVCPGRKVTYGFGYDSNLDDYKLVMISDFEKAGCFKIDIYTMKLDSWNCIQGALNYSFYGKRFHGVLFNGCLHWLGFSRTKATQVIVCFEISTERMVEIPLTENIMPPRYLRGAEYMKVGVWEDSICVTCVREHFISEVWVMQEYGVNESWIKKYIRIQCHLLPLGRPREDLDSYWQPLWCFENGKILVDNCREDLILYDPTNDTVRSVEVRGIIMDDNRESYVESIVSLNSGTYMEKQITVGSRRV